MEKVKFYFGTQETFDSMMIKDSNGLYYIDGILYKGDKPYTRRYKSVTSFPIYGEENVTYVNTSNMTVKYWENGIYKDICYPTTQILDENSTAQELASAKAIYNCIIENTQDLNTSLGDIKANFVTKPELDSHIKSNKHLTPEERIKWNDKSDADHKHILEDITDYEPYDDTEIKQDISDIQDDIDDIAKHTSDTDKHLTSQEKEALHTHDNQEDILDKFSEDDEGFLTFDRKRVSAASVIATKEELGNVIVGSGIDVDDSGVISFSGYAETLNADGTTTVDLGGVKYDTDDNGNISNVVVGGVPLSGTTATDADGNTITTVNVGGTTMTTTTDTDGTSSTYVGDLIVKGADASTSIETTVDPNGNTTVVETSSTKTPTGNTQTTTSTTTNTDGSSVINVSTVGNSGGSLDSGFATGTTTTITTDSSGNTTETSEPILIKDGEDNLVHKSDIDDLFSNPDIDDLW